MILRHCFQFLHSLNRKIEYSGDRIIQLYLADSDVDGDAEQCLCYTGMLAEHFNPHVRYGAAMALGISCAGSGYKVCF
ncbi:unnamed protein product [Onchocerca flexuosa]|uniref:RPN1_RPN2_N domain-containing protein n=1 Tax=Onchocerca flexuosa TaxID=387005 RepID=A0A183H368_9BILA|nr:unnamed protein product [Onchocerca flexuosa]